MENRTWLTGSPYPFAGLALLVLAAEERGARLCALLEEVDVEELEGQCSSSSSLRFTSCFVVGRRENAISVGWGESEKGIRWRKGVRIARVMRIRRVRTRRVR